MTHIIEVKELRKSFGTLDVLKQVSFNVEPGEVIAVIGPSGSGKSTMLRSLVHLEDISGGTIRIQDQTLVDNGRYVGAADIRKMTDRMGMVFQHFNLFPHLTVQANLELAPKTLKKKAQTSSGTAVWNYSEKLDCRTRPTLIQPICPVDRNSVLPLPAHS